MRLEGKIALITGGESGIGLATARLLASEGARVHLLGLQSEPLAGGAPEEIAQAVLYLAADSGAMVNSQQFSIDGGLSAM